MSLCFPNGRHRREKITRLVRVFAFTEQKHHALTSRQYRAAFLRMAMIGRRYRLEPVATGALVAIRDGDCSADTLAGSLSLGEQCVAVAKIG